MNASKTVVGVDTASLVQRGMSLKEMRIFNQE
jgi:hypothetical protein